LGKDGKDIAKEVTKDIKKKPLKKHKRIFFCAFFGYSDLSGNAE
jgi:hypothetical protein